MSDWHDIGRYALSALWVFGLLAAFLWWLQKKRGVPFAKHLDKKIQILEVYPMGLKNKMMLVQVDDQRMLLSMNTQDIRTLHTWTLSPQVQSQEDRTPNAKDDPATPSSKPHSASMVSSEPTFPHSESTSPT